MIRAWRLSPAAYVDRIVAGGGAYRQGGRWNSPGRAVVYMSECLSLSVLESLVHMVKMNMMRGFKCVWADIPNDLITTVEEKDLPADWKAVPAPASTKAIGDRWFDARISPVLEVPSTIISIEQNFVLNPLHPDFHRLQIGDILDFEFDTRLLVGPEKNR